MVESPFLVRLRDVAKLFRSDDGRTVRALDGINLEIRQREFVVLMGPNGSGKSTLFRMLDGQLEPDAGSISWDQVSFLGAANGRSPVRVAHVPQDPRSLAFPDMTLEEHMVLAERAGSSARLWHRGVTASRRSAYRQVLEELDLQPLAESLSKPLGTLSAGWQQVFVVIVTAMSQKLRADAAGPVLLLLDEPTSALDVENARLCSSLIRRLHEDGYTVILATHDPAFALEMADRICVLQHGRLVADLPVTACGGVENLHQLLTDSATGPPEAPGYASIKATGGIA